jgi:arylsulfatase A-like enzyme
MSKTRRSGAGALGLLLTAALGGCADHQAGGNADPAHPRLVVMIVVDQLRQDYLTRLRSQFTPSTRSAPGGFRWFTDRGAEFTSAHYNHFPLYTGPGHATVLTGGYPYKTGIVANDWWSAAERKPVYCVDDPTTAHTGVFGGDTEPMSARNLRCTTVGDELKLATGGQAKVVSVALKDRAAILMAGRLADAVVWYDPLSGNWVSSKAYGPQLPAWAAEVNGRKLPDAERGRPWKPLLTSDQMLPFGAFSIAPGGGLERQPQLAFAQAINDKVGESGPGFYKTFTFLPAANEFTFETAEAAVQAEGLGRHETPDLLAISLSSNDYVGHLYGANSHEALDFTLRTDRALGQFLAFLEGWVPGGLSRCTLALTADHGSSPAPEMMAKLGFPAGQIDGQKLASTVAASLSRHFGKPFKGVAGGWALSRLLPQLDAGPSPTVGVVWIEPYLTIEPKGLAAAGLDAELAADEAAKAVAAVEGVYGAWPTHRLLAGQVPPTDLGQRLARAVYPGVSGSVLVVLNQLWLAADPAYYTSHGQPYAYDSAVPLLLGGWGVKPGVYRGPASPNDLAPTFSQLLGILPPSACEGQALAALR